MMAKQQFYVQKDGNIAAKQADFDWNWTQNGKTKLLCPKIMCILDINGVENQNMSNAIFNIVKYS